MQRNTSLLFIVDATKTENKHPEPNSTKGFIRTPRPEPQDTQIAELSVDSLKQNLKEVTDAVSDFLSDIRAVGEFHLQEVQMQVEVSAEGGIHFIGTAKAGGKGAITLTFARPKSTTNDPQEGRQ
jgi:hypothetical protein